MIYLENLRMKQKSVSDLPQIDPTFLTTIKANPSLVQKASVTFINTAVSESIELNIIL